MIRFISAVALLAIAPLSARAQQASPADTTGIEAAAQAYLDAYSAGDTMAGMMEAMMQQVPPALQEQVRGTMARIDMDALEDVMRRSMVTHFTVAELQALTAFYTSPEGHSAMGKMPAYMADAMPAIQQEMVRAMTASE